MKYIKPFLFLLLGSILTVILYFITKAAVVAKFDITSLMFSSYQKFYLISVLIWAVPAIVVIIPLFFIMRSGQNRTGMYAVPAILLVLFVVAPAAILYSTKKSVDQIINVAAQADQGRRSDESELKNQFAWGECNDNIVPAGLASGVLRITCEFEALSDLSAVFLQEELWVYDGENMIHSVNSSLMKQADMPNFLHPSARLDDKGIEINHETNTNEGSRDISRGKHTVVLDYNLRDFLGEKQDNKYQLQIHVARKSGKYAMLSRVSKKYVTKTYEIELIKKSAVQDTDQDGLSDEDEKKYGTDPSIDDTDRDGFSDGEEIGKGYNPLGSGKIAVPKYCSDPPTILENGREVYPVNLEKYGSTNFLTELFTASDCDPERTGKIFGVNELGWVTIRPDILLKDKPPIELVNILLGIEFAPGDSCQDQDTRECRHWTLQGQATVESILRLKDYANQIESCGCIDCG